MSLYEPRCVVCGACLGKGALFEEEIRESEVCSYECFELYMTEEGVTEECESCGYKHKTENCPQKM